MSTFYVPLQLADLRGSRWEQVDALVDTGSSFTSASRGLLERLGIRPVRRQPFKLADGRVAESDVGYAMVRLVDMEGPTPVIFGEPDEEPLLGAVTLESFLLAVDPVNERLISVLGLRMRRRGPRSAI